MKSIQLTILFIAFIVLASATEAFGFRARSSAAHFNARQKRAFDSDPNPQQPSNPVIAMVASPMADCAYNTPELQPPANFTPTGCITDLYLRWLESEGIRVVPMSHLWSDDKKKELLDQVNGVMFLGGGLSGADLQTFVANVSFIVNYAVQNPGFFLWGTCQGFQVITILLMNSNFDAMTCDYVGMYPSMLPLFFTDYQTNSVMFGLEAERLGLVYTLETKNSTLNWHHCGITPDHFQPTLADARLISTNVDVNGKPFISSFEIVDGGKNIFAVQFHPERAQLVYVDNAIGHERSTYDVDAYLARFVKQRLQLNNHSFSTQDTVNSMTLDKFPHYNLGWGQGFYWTNV